MCQVKENFMKIEIELTGTELNVEELHQALYAGLTAQSYLGLYRKMQDEIDPPYRSIIKEAD